MTLQATTSKYGIFPRFRSESKRACYVYVFVVYRMFQKSSHKKIKRISPEKIIGCYGKRRPDKVKSIEKFVKKQEKAKAERRKRKQLKKQGVMHDEKEKKK